HPRPQPDRRAEAMTAPGTLAPAATPAGPGRAAQVSVRRPGTSDREALVRMFDRCTPSTRYRRFHGPVKAIPERYLADALSGGAFHYALVAWHDATPWPGEAPVADASAAGASPRAAVALASCRIVAEGAAEVCILVEE